MRNALRVIVTRYEMAWHTATVLMYAAALGLVAFLFPDVSNLWVSLLVLFGSFTASVTAMIGAIKAKGSDGGASDA